MKKSFQLTLPFAALLTVLAACRGAALPPGQYAGAAPEKAPPSLIGHNLLYNESFSEGSRALPWTSSFSVPAAGSSFRRERRLYIEVTDKGSNRWDAHLRQQHLALLKGHTYSVQFKMRASQKTRAYLKVGQAGPPYHGFWKMLFNLDTKPQVYSGTFTMTANDDPTVEVAFHVAGQLAKTGHAALQDLPGRRAPRRPAVRAKPPEMPPAIPMVLVNQVGYFPRLAKIATVRNPNAISWQLLDAGKKVVAQGTTVPFFGPDAASGD